MYVCVSKAVTDSQIITAIGQGVCTRKQLTHCFGVGKDCGKCNKDVAALLKKNAGQDTIALAEKVHPQWQKVNSFKPLVFNSVSLLAQD